MLEFSVTSLLEIRNTIPDVLDILNRKKINIEQKILAFHHKENGTHCETNQIYQFKDSLITTYRNEFGGGRITDILNLTSNLLPSQWSTYRIKYLIFKL